MKAHCGIVVLDVEGMWKGENLAVSFVLFSSLTAAYKARDSGPFKIGEVIVVPAEFDCVIGEVRLL